MKNFDEFKELVDKQIFSEWEENAIKEIHEKIDEQHENDPAVKDAMFIRAYAYNVALKLIKEYHDWLHADE